MPCDHCRPRSADGSAAERSVVMTQGPETETLREEMAYIGHKSLTALPMFGLFKKAYDFQKCATTLGLTYNNLITLEGDIDSDFDWSELRSRTLVIAYMLRKGCLERLDKHQWPMHTGISIPNIATSGLTIATAYGMVYMKLSRCAVTLSIESEVEEVLEGGPMYSQIDREVPQPVKKAVE